jgi:hypothetical protein
MKVLLTALRMMMVVLMFAGVGHASVTVFNDTFDGGAVDEGKWVVSKSLLRFHQYGGPSDPYGYWEVPSGSPSYGTVTVANSWVSLKNGSSTVFPYVETRSNPFPDKGNFALEFKMKYDSVNPHGTGFKVRRADSDNPLTNDLFSIWQDSSSTYNLSVGLLGQGWRGMAYDTAAHVYRLEYRDGSYTLYIDGSKKIGPIASTIRPSQIWFGNPVWAWWGTYPWTTLSVDYVTVQKDDPPLPVANAGLDQTVNEGEAVTLDGSGSTSPVASYAWSQLAGPPVSLNLADPVHPTFVAPEVTVGGATLTFQLTVNDGYATSLPDTVNVTVKNVNHPPVADAGDDQTVAEGATVQLNGADSYDPDGDFLSYSWVQTGGPAVQLSHAGAAQPTFAAPLVGTAGATLTFALTVSDGIDSSTDTVNIVVENVNHPPVANAGVDQTRNEGVLVELDGSRSLDPDLDALSYQWTQIGGGVLVPLSDPSSPKPTFVAPLVNVGGVKLVYQLVVSDGQFVSQPAQVSISILNVNDPPACDLARAAVDSLWPPNHKLAPVSITGVSDPDNDALKLTITGVTQDEPVNGLGDGDTSPDAAIQGATALLRAERSGTGNGRVYHVHFTADDGQGGTCSGSVKVAVPHSKGQGDAALDGGELYDSLQP